MATSAMHMEAAVAANTYLEAEPAFESFDFLIYVLSNFVMTLGGCLLLKAHIVKQDISFISRDMEILLSFGNIMRIYWSCAPPEIWSQETTFMKYITVAELFLSVCVWTFVLILGGGYTYRDMPWYRSFWIDRSFAEQLGFDFICAGAGKLEYSTPASRARREREVESKNVGGSTTCKNDDSCNSVSQVTMMSERRTERSAAAGASLEKVSGTGAEKISTGFDNMGPLAKRSTLKPKRPVAVKSSMMPIQYNWPALVVICAVLAFLGDRLMHWAIEGKTLYDEETPSWPFAPYVMILNMCIDTASMLPQMHLIANAEDTAPPTATNFIGLLGFSRFLRMLFWIGTIAQHYWMFGSVPEEFPSLVPDLVYTAVMGEYLVMWLRKLKQDSFDLLDEKTWV